MITGYARTLPEAHARALVIAGRGELTYVGTILEGSTRHKGEAWLIYVAEMRGHNYAGSADRFEACLGHFPEADAQAMVAQFRQELAPCSR